MLSSAALRKLRRQRRSVLPWTRTRREAPIGMVARGDRLAFKRSGGPVVARATVARVYETLVRGRYHLRVTLRQFAMLPIPFHVVKRDRRSWVICDETDDARQQALFTTPALSVEDIETLLRSRYRRLPSRRALDDACRAILADMRDARASATLVLLSVLHALRTTDHLPADLRRLLRGHPSWVYPLAVFRRRDLSQRRRPQTG